MDQQADRSSERHYLSTRLICFRFRRPTPQRRYPPATARHSPSNIVRMKILWRRRGDRVESTCAAEAAGHRRPDIRTTRHRPNVYPLEIRSFALGAHLPRCGLGLAAGRGLLPDHLERLSGTTGPYPYRQGWQVLPGTVGGPNEGDRLIYRSGCKSSAYVRWLLGLPAVAPSKA
jgi:hypothetical protein